MADLTKVREINLGESDVSRVEMEDTQKDKYLTFELGKEFYGLEIQYVKEIIGIQKITEIPELPNYVKGIINLRGKIVPVIDVRLKFRKEFKEYDERTCIVVVEIKDVLIGLIVDTISEVISISEEEISQPPNVSNIANKKIKGIGKVGNEVKIIVDCEKLFSDEEFDIIDEIDTDNQT